MREIPSYGLYATHGLDHWVDSVHIESIPKRSSPNNWEIKPHLHQSFIQVLHLTRGGGAVGIGGRIWHVKAPCILSIPEQIVHSFRFLPEVDGPVITAVQHVLELMVGASEPDMLHVVREPIVMEFDENDPDAGELAPLFEAIFAEFRSHRVGQAGICMSLLSALMMRIGRIHHSKGLPLRAGSTRKARQIQKFRELVDHRFRDHAALAVYADELGMTVGNLSRLCRDVLGMPASAVIDARLVREAQRDLVYTSDAIKVLAGRLGFEDEVYFSRFFRKHVGLSPVEFRQQVRDQIARGH